MAGETDLTQVLAEQGPKQKLLEALEKEKKKVDLSPLFALASPKVAEVLMKTYKRPISDVVSAAVEMKLTDEKEKLVSSFAHKQLTTIEGEDGQAWRAEYDKETGKITPIAPAGYAPSTYTDPATGKVKLKKSLTQIKAGAIRQGASPKEAYATIADEASSGRADLRAQEMYDLIREQRPLYREQIDSLGKEFRKEAEVIDEFESKVNALDQLVEANIDGTIGAIKRNLARTVGGEKGVLTDRDVESFGGTDKLATSIGQYIHAKTHGGMTPAIQRNFKKIMDVANKNIQTRRRVLENKYITPVVLRGADFKMTPDAARQMIGASYVSPDITNLPEVKISYSAAQEAGIKAVMESNKGASREEVIDALIKAGKL